MGENISENELREITINDWTLFDKVMYGGFGYSHFCLPQNILIISLSIIYPPLGLLVFLINQTISNSFPYITIKTIRALFDNLDKIAMSIIYTMLFYLPGLIYVFNNTIYTHHPDNHPNNNSNDYSNSSENES